MSGRATFPLSRVSVAVVGLGNIGSQVAPLLPGLPEITRVLFVDPDAYEPVNLGRQRITPADMGRRKVDVQARALRRLAPHLTVQTHACAVEALPLGVLRECDVIVGCVDARLARQSINRLAFALGMPWIDAALDREGLVRSRLYTPGADCLECAWSAADYALLEQRLPCDGVKGTAAVPQAAATAAPQELGALAAGLQVTLLRRLLSGDSAGIQGRQFFFDARTGRGWVGSYTPNPQCLADHQPWQITDLARSAARLSLGEALRLVDCHGAGDDADSELSLHGQIFVRRLRCARCGAQRPTAGVYERLRTRACRRCGGTMTASAADVTELLSARQFGPRRLDAPLSSFGLVDGDVFALRTPRATHHFHLAGPGEQGAC